jgi:hypothetical protein
VSPAGKRKKTTPLPLFRASDEEVTWAGLGCLVHGLVLVLGCDGPPGELLSLYIFLFIFCFYFLFSSLLFEFNSDFYFVLQVFQF